MFDELSSRTARPLSPPARLQIDRQDIDPPVATEGTDRITVRFHVSACGGRTVHGALVYVTAVPYNQFSIPAEQATGQDGWAHLAAVIDCHDRELVGHEFAQRGRAREAERALEEACIDRFGTLRPEGTTPVVRSDNGLIFQSRRWR